MALGQVFNCATGEIETVTVPDPTLDELKERAKADIEARCDGCFAAGWTVSGTGTALDGKVLQTRDIEDRTNWLTSQAAYSAAVAGGNGAVAGAVFRTAANETLTLTYAEGLAVLLDMAAWGKAIMGNSWALKDAVAAAADNAALAAIDIAAGWP